MAELSSIRSDPSDNKTEAGGRDRTGLASLRVSISRNRGELKIQLSVTLFLEEAVLNNDQRESSKVRQ